MLIEYLARYLLSSCLTLSQGKSPHSKQYFALPVRKIVQVLILHRIRVIGFFVSALLQPGHLFFSLKYAIQIPQFIPQGAIRENLFKDSIFFFSHTLNHFYYATHKGWGIGQSQILLGFSSSRYHLSGLLVI